MAKKNIIIILGLIFQFFCQGYVFGETKITPANQQKYHSCEECTYGFSLADLDYNNLIADDKTAVDNCVYCKAVLNNNINECNSLAGASKVICNENFNGLQGFYLKILGSDKQSASMDIILGCVKAKIGDAKSCKQYADSILSKDVKKCSSIYPSKANQCAALINLNEKLAKDTQIADIIIYAKALRDVEIKSCDNIKEKTLRIACKANISGDEKTCINESGFAAIREKFCRNTCRK